MARLFFITTQHANSGIITFNEEDVKHLLVLRKKKGDVVTCILSDSDNKYKVKVEILQASAGGYTGKVLSQEIITSVPEKNIHLLQCIPKLDKMEYIIQKAAEIGATSIVPLFSRNTVIKNEVGEHKYLRWEKIGREASIQSGRTDIIVIEKPQPLVQYLSFHTSQLLASSAFGLLLNETEKKASLRDYVAPLQDNSIKDIYLLIGAEGGFSREEIHAAVTAYQFHSLTLGEHILRAETAPVVALSIIKYITGSI